ncbi:MAG TPA: hypothetical protein VGL13_06750, partial [Polyangiaceae bacterium]
MRTPLASRAIALSTALMVFAGCQAQRSAAGPVAKAPASPRGSIQATAVTDESFANSVQHLLRDSKPSAERLNLL